MSKAPMPFRQRAAHVFDQPDRPPVDALGRANPNSDQLAALAHRLRELRKLTSGDQTLSGSDWDSSPEARQQRQQTAKEGRDYDNGKHERGSVPRAFGKNKER